MRTVIFVLPYFYPKTGGMENYAYNIALGLIKSHKWNVVVITSNHEHNSYSQESINGINVYRLPTLIKASNTPINPLWFSQIKKIIQREKPDIINGHTPVPYISDISARVAKELEIPFVLTYQNDLVKDSFIAQRLIELYYLLQGKKTLELATQIIATSKGYVIQSPYLKKHQKKTTIIPPGIPRSANKSEKPVLVKGLEKKDRVLLFVGQLDKTHTHKGIDILFRSIKNVQESEPAIKLVLVGKGDAISSYKQLAKKLGIENNILFTGFLTDSELQGMYSRSEMVILPSTSNSEGFGMVILEAYAAKKPVVASKVGGIVSIVEDSRTGLLVPPKNPEALANAIIKLLMDTKLSKKLGENGYKLVISNYYWEHQVDKTNTLFTSLL